MMPTRDDVYRRILQVRPWGRELSFYVRWFLVGCILLAGSFVFLWSNTPYDIDDAPITYRYADNIAEGNGFVYNEGERILGTSTPLYALLLAVFSLLGISVPMISNAINFIASVALLAATMALVRELSDSFWAGLLAGVILLVQGSFLRYSMAGMETPLYALLVVSSLLALAQNMTLIGAALAALTVLARLDGLSVVGVVLLVCLVRRRELPWREAGIMGLILAPWLIFAVLYFGSPLPQSMLAKQQHFQARQSEMLWIWDHLFVRPMSRGMFLTPFVASGAVWSLRKRLDSSKWFGPTVWLVAYLLAYTLVQIDFYEWYLVPAYPVLAGFAANGLSLVVKRVGKIRKGPRRLYVVAVGLAFSALLIPYVRRAYRHVAAYRRYLLSLESSRVSVGTWLRDQTSPESKVETGAIGHVGYASGRYIVDSAGLITTQAIRASVESDYLVLCSPPVGREQCGPVKYFETGWPACDKLVVSRCSEVKGVFGSLVLAEARITEWVLDDKGTLHKESSPFLETQWRLEGDGLDRDWTLFVHFTRPGGEKVAQADHLLSLSTNALTLPTSEWPTDRRLYDYVPLPEEVEGLTEAVEVRLGV